MLVRERFEKEYRPLYETYGYGTTVWGPVCAGILTGKFNDGSIPEGSRYAKDQFMANWIIPRYFGPTVKDATLKKLKALAELAKELGAT